MSRIGKELPKEYSDRFDELRQNRVEVSYYKYGTAADNFGNEAGECTGKSRYVY